MLKLSHQSPTPWQYRVQLDDSEANNNHGESKVEMMKWQNGEVYLQEGTENIKKTGSPSLWLLQASLSSWLGHGTAACGLTDVVLENSLQNCEISIFKRHFSVCSVSSC